jgi:hypothetical protein
MNTRITSTDREGSGNRVVADWGCCCCYLRGAAAAVGAGGVVGDGLGADVAEAPEDAGADDLRAHRVRGQALLVPPP